MQYEMNIEEVSTIGRKLNLRSLLGRSRLSLSAPTAI